MKMNSGPRSEALRTRAKLPGQSFSQGHYPLLYQQDGKGFISSIHNNLIFLLHAFYGGKEKTAAFCWPA